MIYDEFETVVDWREVWQELLRNYPQIITFPEDEPKYEAKYKAAFYKLATIDRIDSDLVLRIKKFYEDGERFVDVAAYDEQSQEKYSMKTSPWGMWKGLEIAQETFEKFSFAEIVAHCLYGMTWFGPSTDGEFMDYFEEDIGSVEY